MKELLCIYNANELPIEIRIKLIQKLWKILDYEIGANLYEDISNELCDLLINRMKNMPF
jgi:hypothetical protein